MVKKQSTMVKRKSGAITMNKRKVPKGGAKLKPAKLKLMKLKR